MNGSESSYTQIRDIDLEPYVSKANLLLSRIRWKPSLPASEQGKLILLGWAEKAVALEQSETALPEIFKVLDNDALILSQSTNTVLEVLRDAVAVGLYVQNDMAKRIGLSLSEQNDSLMKAGMSAETRNKKNFLSVVQLFTAAYYVVWHLWDYHKESRATMQKAFPGLAECVIDHTLDEQGSCFRSTMHYYAQMAKSQNGMISGKEELIDATLKYFQAVIDYLKTYKIPGISDAVAFESARFSLEGSGFSIDGFTMDLGSVQKSATEFKKTLFSQIIGNHVGKSRLSRTLKLMFLRDKETEINPALRYGGLPNVFFMQGKPGAGKTLLISAVATMALDLSEKTGIKVNIMIYPRNIVSKYQGVSSERAMAFWQKTKVPGALTLVFMDEAEQLIPDRDNDRASSGSKSGTNAFLVATEGVDQIDEGNRLIILATNHAHQCDPAVLSRAKEKVEINGAESVHDYMDFIRLVIGFQDHVFEPVLMLKDPENYEFMRDQKNPPKKEDLQDDSPVLYGLDNILAKVETQYRRNQYDFFGQLFYLFQRANPAFSLRDLRNIFEATLFDISQYDIPDSFFEKEGTEYHAKPLEEKALLLRSLLEKYLRESGKNFPDSFLENALRQMKEIEKIEQIEHDRGVKAAVGRIRIEQDALEKVKSIA